MIRARELISAIRMAFVIPVQTCRGRTTSVARDRVGDGRERGTRQIARRSPIDFPDDRMTRIGHKAIIRHFS